MRDPLQGTLTLSIQFLLCALCVCTLMKASLSQAPDTLTRLVADKEQFSSDWISLSWKWNLCRLAGGCFNCLWTGSWKGADWTGPGVWSSSLSSKNWPVGCWAICLAIHASRPSLFVASDPCLRHHAGHTCSYPSRHTQQLIMPPGKASSGVYRLHRQVSGSQCCSNLLFQTSIGITSQSFSHLSTRIYDTDLLY